MNVKLAVGDVAPDFELPIAGGGRVRLSELRGAPVVVWFYPEANTSLCTKQACDLRDHFEEFADAGARIIGISPDELPAIERFVAEQELPFMMASDPAHEVMEQYGAWGEKNMYGVVRQGVIRSTFVVDPGGVLSAVKYRVGTPSHVEFVRGSLVRMP